jgi:AcrR family transcriptional regulator
MEDFVANVTPLLETAPDPTAAVSTIVDAHLRFDASHRDQVLVSAHERRSLPAQQQRPINALRARHRDAVVDTIEQGRAAGAFTVDDAQIAANGVLDLLSGVKEWYEPREHGKLDALVVRYQRLVLALLRHGGGPPDAVSAGAA